MGLKAQGIYLQVGSEGSHAHQRFRALQTTRLPGKNACEGLAFRGVQQLSFMLSLLDILCPLASCYLN